MPAIRKTQDNFTESLFTNVQQCPAAMWFGRMVDGFFSTMSDGWDNTRAMV